MIWEIMVGTVVASFISYLIGSFSFSITIVKLKTNSDVREQGSKNAGATNASRIIGKKWGTVIVFLDASKIVISILVTLALSQIPTPFFQNTILIIPAFFTLIGHCWPIFYNFKGGKAVSCFMGLIFTINYVLGLVLMAIWLTLLFTSKKVSLASIAAAIVIAILMWIPQVSWLPGFDIDGSIFKEIYLNNNFTPIWYNKFHEWNKIYTYDSFLIINIVTTLSMFIVLYRHFENIKRLIKGTEPSFIKSRKDKKNNQEKIIDENKGNIDNNKQNSQDNIEKQEIGNKK